MQRKIVNKPNRLRAGSQRPSKGILIQPALDISETVPGLMIRKAPVHRVQPKEVSTSQIQAENDLLRRRVTKLSNVHSTQIFKELKTQHKKKQDQIRRLRDIAEFAGAMRSSDFRAIAAGHELMLLMDFPSPEQENVELKKHLHRLEQSVTELRIDLYRVKQECDSLSSWLARMGINENTENFEPVFDIDSMTYEELLALEDRIGYVKVGLSLSARAVSSTQRLPIVSLEGKEAEELCCVCLQPFGDSAKRLPGCRHLFHPKCIDEWLELKKTCPLCVSEVEV